MSLTVLYNAGKSKPKGELKMTAEKRKEKIEKLIRRLAFETDAALNDEVRTRLDLASINTEYATMTEFKIAEAVQKRLYRLF